MTDEKMHKSGAPYRNFYGRLKGKGLRDSQQAYLEEDLAGLSPGKVGWEENPERVPLDLEALFGGKEVWLETGFGGGEHLVHQAALNSDIGIIGRTSRFLKRFYSTRTRGRKSATTAAVLSPRNTSRRWLAC